MESGRQAGIAVLRVVVGIVFFMHGKQKLMGFGYHGVVGFLHVIGLPLPQVAAVFLLVAEVGGGIALILGVLTRWAAMLNACDMLVALLMVHWKNGFFLPHGYEFALTLLAANICLIFAGPGTPSVDSLMARRQ